MKIKRKIPVFWMIVQRVIESRFPEIESVAIRRKRELIRSFTMAHSWEKFSWEAMEKTGKQLLPMT